LKQASEEEAIKQMENTPAATDPDNPQVDATGAPVGAKK